LWRLCVIFTKLPVSSGEGREEADNRGDGDGELHGVDVLRNDYTRCSPRELKRTIEDICIILETLGLCVSLVPWDPSYPNLPT
jgi:hypothetical protein